MLPDIPLLKRVELADRLGLCTKTIFRYEHVFASAVIRVGRSVYYDFPAVLQLIKQRGSLLPPPSRRSAASTKNKPKTKGHQVILTSTQEYVPHAPGVFPAVCVDLIDLGLREMEFQGRHRMVPRLCIVWETEAPDGGRHSISRTFTASLNAKAKLSEFLAHWRGKVITPGETIDMSKLIGLCCTLVISHQQRVDGTGVFSRVEAAGRPTRTITPSGTYDGKLMRAQITARAALPPMDRPDAAPSVDDDVPF